MPIDLVDEVLCGWNDDGHYADDCHNDQQRGP